MKNKFFLLPVTAISIFLLGCANKNSYIEESKNIVKYSISTINYKASGKQDVIINEFINGKKVRIVKEIVIFDNELPKTIDFDGCESIKTIKVVENTKNGYVNKENINGKNYYLKSDCISTLNFSKDSNNNINVEGFIKTIHMMEYSKNNLKPFIPLVNKSDIKIKKWNRSINNIII